MAIFFFPGPPEIASIKHSFRTLPDVEFQAMPRSVRMLLRRAKVMQMNLIELNEGVNPSQNFIIKDISFDPNHPVTDVAKEIRSYLSVPLREQVSWNDRSEEFKKWRNVRYIRA